MFLKVFLVLCLVGVCLGLLHRAAAASQIKIIVTTDVHGNVMADSRNGAIGYALLKRYVDEMEKAGRRVFLLDSGDAFSGSAFAQVDHGRSIAELLAMMGYRVLTPGNHAFDHNAVENDPLYYSRVLLKTVKERSAGPVAATAINLSRDGQALPETARDPVIIYEEPRGTGMRLIVAGVVTPYTARPSLRDSLPGYDFGLASDPAETKRKILADLAASLREFDRPGDVVVVLSHLGYAGPDGDREGRITGPDLAEVPNIDFVADGHTHTAIEPHRLGRALYGNGGRHLEHFLEITIGADGGGSMELKGYADVAGLRPDPEIAAWLSERERLQGLSETVCTLPDSELFGDGGLRTDNTPLGRLICRAMLRVSGADLAMHNVGGIRAGLPGGPVSLRALYDVLPFGDDLAVVSLSGREIAALFDRGSGHGGRGFPQFFGITAYAWRTPEDRLRSVGFLGGDGGPLADGAHYRVAMNSIMAKAQGLSGRSDGELIKVVRKDLAGMPDLRLEEVTGAGSLLIFANREDAENAFREALVAE